MIFQKIINKKNEEITKQFEEEFNYLGENTTKLQKLLVQITKEIKRIDKNGE